MKMSRVWAMPSADTFSVPPIAEFVARHIRGVSVDPFARNSMLADWRNDLDPRTRAESHLDAEEFLRGLTVKADTLIFDPPYSPRQIAEVYASVGMAVGMKETQSAVLYQRVREAAREVLAPDATVLSFGWNSAGFGPEFEFEEILLVCHGGAHNDTICVAQRRVQPRLL